MYIAVTYFALQQFEMIVFFSLAYPMRRLQEDETPLMLCLYWTRTDGHEKLDRRQFVLQENDPGDIMVC